MVLTQDSVLSLLLAQGGRVRKSELVSHFRDSVDSVNAAEKERNRELFKTLVNNVAVVKEIDGVRYVVIKKVYQRLLENTEKGEQPSPPEKSEGTVDSSVGDISGSAPHPAGEEGGENPSELLSPIQLALRRSKFEDIRVKRMLTFDVHGGANEASTAAKSKPFALPLRTPPSATRVEICKLKVDPGDAAEEPDVSRIKKRLPSVDSGGGHSSPRLTRVDILKLKAEQVDTPQPPDTSRNKKRPPSVDDRTYSNGSPQLRRAVKSTKASEDHKVTKGPSMVPLEESEHEWLVRCAAGHWSQVYGLLLRDSQLAEKRDFMSGFTALHWAAKCGNSEMLVKIIDLSRQGGAEVDINAKTHGGYTPLHIAALHDQEYIMAMLVGECGANISLRDNCGKKAYHYLHKGVSKSIREMLGAPQVRQVRDKVLQQETEEAELLPDLSKGFHSISRLFQPHLSAHKKKNKQRAGLYSMSLSEEPGEDRGDSSTSAGFRQRVASDVFI